MVRVEQISALLDYLESQPELALGHCTRTSEGRSLAKRRWTECAQILNSIAPDCPRKSPTEWRSFYNEFKCKVMRKIKLQKREMNATGGRPAKKIILTPLQERLYTILEGDIGKPLAGVYHNSLSETNHQIIVGKQEPATEPVLELMQSRITASNSQTITSHAQEEHNIKLQILKHKEDQELLILEQEKLKLQQEITKLEILQIQLKKLEE